MIKYRSLGIRFVLAAVLGIAVAATGCDDGGGPAAGGTGGSGGGVGGTGGAGGGGGTVSGAVTADPQGMAFDPPSVTVTLTADDPTATIYYTTDLSPVDPPDGAGGAGGMDASTMEYDGPITIGATTVLKFLAQSTDGTNSAEQLEGYTLIDSPIRAEWAMSGHGDITADPWRYWDKYGEVWNFCARCHGGEATQPPPTPPFRGFLEWAETGKNTLAAPNSLGLDCVNCHQQFPSIYTDLATYAALEPVKFPSAALLSLYSASNICMGCHQGRASGESVLDAIKGNPEGPYTFINIHYYSAAATMFGSGANGGFEYAGKWYRARNSFPSHPGTPGMPGEDFSTCVGCHMKLAGGVGVQHTWDPNIALCNDCHSGASFEELSGTPSQSYDNITILLPELYAEIQRYAAQVIKVPIVYEEEHPYFFRVDNGEPYDQFDQSLLKAAYNYQVGQKDPAAFIHSGTYLQQLLYDSIVDLGGSTAVAVLGRDELTKEGADIGTASKTQQWQISAHGALETDPFRHWDGDTVAPGSNYPAGIEEDCTRCHSTAGFGDYAMGASPTSYFPTTGVDCWACHSETDLFADPATRYSDLATNPDLEPIVFPSGDEATFMNNSNICMACHQGRSSTVQVNAATPNSVVQTPTDYDSYDFAPVQIHYYAAAASLFGSDVQGGYEYAMMTYRGQNMFPGLHTDATTGRNLVDCVGCHMNGSLGRNPPVAADTKKHTFLPAVADCTECHSGDSFPTLSGAPSRNFNDIRLLKQDLLNAIKAYADVGGGLPNASPVFYDGNSYPYWFFDNGQGPIYPNQYVDFDFDMLTAAYNYVVADKEPGGYIHNGLYITELLYDSTVLMGGTPRVTPVTRP